MKEFWFIRLKAETHTMDGKRRRINRAVPVGDHLQTTLDTVNKVERPWEFYGVTLHVFTPIHHTEYVIDPDTRKISCIS